MRILLCVCCLWFVGSAMAIAGGLDHPPNIIFILADDLGVGNVGCYGADRYRTPHLDRLAASGLRYTRSYTAPLCGPSRALIMTGRYAFRTGATNQDRVGRLKPADEVLLPAYLQRAGYRTGCFGKWSQFPLQPSDWGFDEYLRFSGSGVYRNTDAKGETYVVNGETRRLTADQYMPDLLHQQVTDFIRRHHEQPFFVYYSMSSVHGELLPTPDSPAAGADLMADNVSYMDKLIGQLVSELQQQKLLERTLIVFMGDNGTGKAQADSATIGGRRLLGQKGTMQEGGALVPLIVSWPGVIAGGRVSDGVMDSTDFLPTFLELCGQSLPTDRVIDGRSLLAQWRDAEAVHREWVFVQLARSWYVREAEWKLTQAGELFDMSGAPFAERLVVASAETALSGQARQRLQSVLDRLNPAGGILDDGDGSGRHAGRDKKGQSAD